RTSIWVEVYLRYSYMSREFCVVPIASRDAVAINTFEGIGCTSDLIENRLDRTSTKWTEHDVAQLIVIYNSIQRGEVTAEDEFPAPRVSADELTGGKADKPATTPAK